MNVKDILANIGIDTCVEFCALNGIPQPTLHIARGVDDSLTVKIKSFATCGYYRNNSIYVGVPLCAHQSPLYSWAGFIADRTPFGVIQHELGHHVDQWKTDRDLYRTRGHNFSDTVRDQSDEKPITSYSPNTMEWFAEIFRLFITNPDLLRQIRPKAYRALIGAGFKPIETQTATEVLKKFEAPQKVYYRMQNWLDKGK